MSVTIHKGSILDARTDAIANPANSFLNHAGGLAKIIAEAAAPRTPGAAYLDDTEPGRAEKRAAEHAWWQEQKNAPLIATGNAHVTSSGVLPYKGIIHAVGPIWNGGLFTELDLYELTMESIYERCYERAFGSVAIPAVSCGIFGFPVEEAARLAVDVAVTYGDKIDTQFWLFEDAHVDAWQRRLDYWMP